MSLDALQVRVIHWTLSRFGAENLLDRKERAARLLEEALELAQAEGVDTDAAGRIYLRVYSRPAGGPVQEAAAVGLCLLAWASSAGRTATELLGLITHVMSELEAIPVEESRAKHAAKVAAGTALR